MRILKANAELRRSSQCFKDVESLNRSESGKTLGKPRDLRPLADLGKKLVKLPTSSNDAQPPFVSLINPLFNKIYQYRRNGLEQVH